MALGRELVRNLKLDSRGAMLERWLAHHLAELMVEAEKATGPAKAEAEARAVDLILQLWARRRDLPAADPLDSYREAIAVLSRLMPDRNPWADYDLHDGPESVFRALFDCMARVVVCGLLLTAERPPREVAAAEEAAMEQEELTLRKHLDWWEKAIRPALPVDVQHLVNPDDILAVLAPDETSLTAELRSTGGQSPAPSDEGSAVEEADEEECDGADNDNELDADDASGDLAELVPPTHEGVRVELERLQQELATLVEHWRATKTQP